LLVRGYMKIRTMPRWDTSRRGEKENEGFIQDRPLSLLFLRATSRLQNNVVCNMRGKK